MSPRVLTALSRIHASAAASSSSSLMIPKREALDIVRELQKLLQLEMDKLMDRDREVHLLKGEIKDLCHLFLLVIPLIKKSTQLSDLLGEEGVKVIPLCDFLFPPTGELTLGGRHCSLRVDDAVVVVTEADGQCGNPGTGAVCGG